MRKFMIVIGVIFGLAALNIAMTWDEEVSREDDPTAGARQACSQWIRSALNDPSSVEWVERLLWPTSMSDDGIITVRAEYRARNALGGMVREVTYCDIIAEGGQLRLVDLRQ